ncbi:hypothetical protein IG631_12488 [Alternaria alternata]|nr:hypothetical protein IG631_12488 [Alternaria alternata]
MAPLLSDRVNKPLRHRIHWQQFQSNSRGDAKAKSRPSRVHVERICHPKRILLTGLQCRGVAAVLISGSSGHRVALCPEGIEYS